MSTIYLLLKMYESMEYIEDFRSGNLFMRKLKSFEVMENDSNEMRGDKHEGVVALYQPGISKIFINDFEIPPEDLVKPVSVKLNHVSEKFAFCMYAVYCSEWDKIRDDQIDEFKNELTIDDSTLNLGGYAVVITNVEEFIKRVIQSFKEKKIEASLGLVRYYDPGKFDGHFEEHLQGFYKRKEFCFQKEYRLLAELDSRNETEKIFIGDISDISIVMKVSEINEKLKICYGEEVL